MVKKRSEKEYSTDDEEPKSLIKKIYKIIRLNWLAFAFALLITLLTIIVVPIVYSLEKPQNPANNTNLTWNIDGKTVLDQNSMLNGLMNPFGIISSIIFDSNNDLFILDQTNHRLLKYSLLDNSLKLIIGNENGTNGSDANSLNSPNDVFIDSTNRIYIADTLNHRIQSWDADNPLGGRTVCGTGTPGNSTDQLNAPMSLTMDKGFNIYIADYENNRIILCNTTTNQSVVFIPSDNGGERHTFVYTPVSIKYHLDTDSLVIAQGSGYNVIRWQLGSNNWTLIAGSASSELNGTSRTLFNQLCHVNIDHLVNTYVTDCYNERIQFYQGDLTKGRTIAGVIQANGTNSYIFNHPTATTLDRDYNLYVADSNNYRIQKFLKI